MKYDQEIYLASFPMALVYIVMYEQYLGLFCNRTWSTFFTVYSNTLVSTKT